MSYHVARLELLGKAPRVSFTYMVLEASVLLAIANFLVGVFGA